MHRLSPYNAIVVVVLIVSALGVAQKTDFALKSGDRVVFFGDSITEQKLYTSYVQEFVLSRYPDRNITFINSGWGGDTVNSNPCVPCAGVGALARIERDVVAHKPTVVTLLFGMNDGLYKDFDPDVMKAYTDGLSQIIAILKRETKARVYVMTPTVYDGSRHTSWSHTDKYNDVLDRYSEAAKEIARREDLPVIDLHTATTVALNAAKKPDKDYTFVPDGVHPGPDGQAVMAAEILRAWGAPEEGTTVEMTTKEYPVLAPLPWPGFSISAQIKQADPILQTLGRVRVRFAQLPAGNYSLTVDGKSAGTFSASQLNTGIDVGVLSEPAQKAAADLAKAVRDKEDLEFEIWRPISLRYADLKATAEAKPTLQKMLDEQSELAREKAKPHKYQITLTRQESK